MAEHIHIGEWIAVNKMIAHVVALKMPKWFAASMYYKARAQSVNGGGFSGDMSIHVAVDNRACGDLLC